MEKTTTSQQIDDERIKFVREKIVVIEEDDLLAKPTGSCPNSKSVLNIEQVVSYQPLPIEEAKLEQIQSHTNLDKLADSDDDEDSDEAVEPPQSTDSSSLVAISFADKQELCEKIANIDTEHLPKILDIIAKYETMGSSSDEIEIDLEKCSNKTLLALQEYLNTGLVPELGEELDLLNEDNHIVKEARKILETGTRRQVKTPQKYNPIEQIRQEVTAYRKKTYDKLVQKKRREKSNSAPSNVGTAEPTAQINLTEEELIAIQKELEDKVKKFLKEQDAEKDMEWFKNQFVVQSVKDDYSKGVEQAVQYISENMFLEDSTLLNSLIEDELLEIENENVYRAVVEVVQKIFTARARQRLEADATGAFYSVADQTKLFNRFTEDMNRIQHFANSARTDDTVDCVSYQSTLEDMFEALLKELEDLFQRRKYALQREELEIAYHIQKNGIEKKSAEYHILYHALQFYVMVEEHLTETLEIIFEWYDNLFGGESDEESEEDEDDDEEEEGMSWDKLEKKAIRADAKRSATKKTTPGSAKKKSKFDSFSDDEEEDEEGDEDDASTDEDEVPKVQIKLKSPAASKATPVQKGKAKKPATKATPKTSAKKQATIPDSDEDLDELAEESVKTPTTAKKSTKKSVPVDTDSVYEFKTLNIFIRDLQKSYLVPSKHIFTALVQDDLKLVVMKVQDTNTNNTNGQVPPQGLKSVDLKTKPNEISLVFKYGSKDQMTLQQLSHFSELYQKISSVKYPFPQQYLEDMLNYYCYIMPQNRALLYVFVYVYLPFYCNIGVKADGSVDFPYLEKKFLQSDTLTLISLDTPIMSLMKDEPKTEIQSVVSLDRQLVDLVTSYYQAIYKKHPRVWEMQRDPQQKLKAVPLPKKEKTKIDKFYANKPASATPKGNAKTKSPAKAEQVSDGLLTGVLYPPY